MSIPKYLMVLANHKGPASVNVGGMALPVKIMDIAKKVFGNKGNFNEVFKKFIPEYGKGEDSNEMPEV